MANQATERPPRLRMLNISKRFGPTQALTEVSLDTAAGEVHALVGENGAGKSTLMKILSGAVRPDAGDMLLDGRAFRPSGPQDARLRGVAMIYQELALAPHLTVEMNVMLGLEDTKWGFVRRQSHQRRVAEALALLDHPEILPDTPVRHLSPAACQLVEVARALVVDASVIVLDEPTSSLTRHDTEHLFALIARLKSRGVSIVYISHFLEEVQRIADRYTVLRDGRTVGSGRIRDTTLEQIVEQMVGRSLTELYPRVPHKIGPPHLIVRELAGRSLPAAASLTLHRGEILGIFGLVGAGRTETVRTLFGLEPVHGGEVRIGALASTHSTPGGRIRQGLGLLSEDRKLEGLALERSIADNLTYSWLRPYSRWGWLNLGLRRKTVAEWLSRLGIRSQGAEQKVSELSGGNQQKVALARLLHQQAEVLLLDEPTRGVDVGSKSEIYRLMGELARQGKAILFISSYLPELLGICDRIAVMSRGRTGAAMPASALTAEQIMAQAVAGGEA